MTIAGKTSAGDRAHRGIGQALVAEALSRGAPPESPGSPGLRSGWVIS
jgi:hypothetical protein